MHIAFDGGSFQQGILGGIYQVSIGFLNAARIRQPDLQVTLVCDPRQGPVREEALAGLSWRPDIVYAPLTVSYDAPEIWPVVYDPHVRFFVDGQIAPAALRDGVATYRGPKPVQSFAIISRSALPIGDGRPGPRRGIRIERIAISDTQGIVARIRGDDRRLLAGFVDEAGSMRWTDGAGFVPIAFFSDSAESVEVDVEYTALDEYPLSPGAGADAVRQIRKESAAAEHRKRLEDFSTHLRSRGCTVYFTNHFTPLILPGLISVAWAYDLIPVLLPQYFHADALLNFNENLRVFAASDRVYAISHSTRDDLVLNSPVESSQALTAEIASSGGFAPQPAPAVSRVLAPLGLTRGNYIIAVATIEPRKNHLRLLSAYIDLRRRMPHCPDLVIVGKMGWDFESVLDLINDSNIDRSVRVISDVPENDLACLYSGALFSAYLSVYEGFGLPIIESMAAGCPVLTSDRSSMAEVAGDAAMLVNPYDVDAITDAMMRLTADKTLRETLAQRGAIRQRHYTWDRTAKTVLDDLVSLHGGE